MSAKLSYALLLAIVSSATADESLMGSLTVRLYREHTRFVTVEEVDRNGHAAVKELELPDYSDSEEAREDDRRRKEQQNEHRSKAAEENCNSPVLEVRKKCLIKWRRQLEESYRSWREAMTRVMKIVDGRMKDLSAEIRRDENRKKG